VLMVLGLVFSFEVDVLGEPKESTLAESIFSSILLAQYYADSKVVDNLSLNIKPKSSP
jgi:hypothetical protein